MKRGGMKMNRRNGIKKINQYKNPILILLIWVVAIQVLFSFLHKGSMGDLERTLLAQLRQSVVHSNFEHIGQSINDLENLNLIQCTTLRIKEKSKIPLIDSSFRGCSEGFIFNFQNKKIFTLSASNGETYHLTTFMGGSQSFVIALWLSRVFGIVVCFLLSFFYGVSKKKNKALLDLKMAQLQMMEDKAKMKEKQAKAVEEIARQVSHDIRSPLTALNVALQDLDSMPERHRVLTRTAVNRINDIANNLLKKSTTAVSNSEGSSLELLSSLVSLVLAEKRMQFRSHIGAEINFILDPNSYGLFAQVEAEKLKRVLSNFINNAVEALPNGRGKIEVGLSLQGDTIQLYVKDNGRGIPDSILSKLGKEPIIHGKEGTESGSGIGVYSARKIVEEWGGKLHIESEWKKGATFFILLPKEKPPNWFVPEIKIHSNMKIVILDDDVAIHEIWKNRFSFSKSVSAELVHFSSSEDFKKWHTQNNNASQEKLYLMDYELIGEVDTGLDIIKKLHLGNESILITSRFDQLEIRERCKSLYVKLIPKELAYLVPIVS